MPWAQTILKPSGVRALCCRKDARQFIFFSGDSKFESKQTQKQLAICEEN